MVHNYEKNKALKKHSKYTIGTVVGERTVFGKKIITYYYNVNRITYKEDGEPGTLKFIVGQRYIVQFSTEAPNYNNILAVEIPDSIKAAPPQGWDKPPGEVYLVGLVENIVNSHKATINFSYKMQSYYLRIEEDFLKDKDIGKRYYISIYPANMEYEPHIYNGQVPDSLSWTSPRNGWKVKPKEIR